MRKAIGMKPENKTILDKNLHHWITLERAFYLRGLNHHEQQDILKAIREEWEPNFNPDLWCGTCLADFVKKAYRNYHEWLRAETGETETYKDLSEGIEKMNEILNFKYATHTI